MSFFDRRLMRFLLLVWLGGIAGCVARPQSEAAAPQPTRPVVVGGDSDVHGCKASAGYAWCSKQDQCVRPWELAKQKGFDNTGDGFKRYCAGT